MGLAEVLQDAFEVHRGFTESRAARTVVTFFVTKVNSFETVTVNKL